AVQSTVRNHRPLRHIAPRKSCAQWLLAPETIAPVRPPEISTAIAHALRANPAAPAGSSRTQAVQLAYCLIESGLPHRGDHALGCGQRHGFKFGRADSDAG